MMTQEKLSNWSQTNYSNINLTDEQHQVNNEWFATQMKTTRNGVCVPELGRCWDKDMTETEIEKYDYVFADLVGAKKNQMLKREITNLEDNLTLAVDLLYRRDLDTYLEFVEAKEEV